jgi:hypothetical protein
MSDRWWRCPVEAWHDKREKPWTEVCAIAELRWWEDQVRRGQQPKMPSRRSLEERFGWSAHRVDKLRHSLHWLPDARMENPYLNTTKKRPRSDQRHARTEFTRVCRSEFRSKLLLCLCW